MQLLRSLLQNKRIQLALGIACAAILLTVMILLLLPENPPPVIYTPPTTETVPEETTLPPRSPNLFGPEDFVMENGVMTCLTAAAILGIDVSGHQGDINWEAVKQDGIDFVFIRVGGRFARSGELYDDSFAQSYYEGAKAAGLKVGAYFFSQAISAEEAEEEALFALQQTKDWALDLPIAFDWEEMGGDVRTSHMDADTLTSCMTAFCETIRQADRQAMIYTNPSYAGVGVDLKQLEGYDIWLALHSLEMTYPYHIRAWQYTDKGSVNGINNPVDMNLLFP